MSLLRVSRFLVPVALAALVLAATPAFAVDIGTCNQNVAAGQTGVLVADLDCGGIVGVSLDDGSKLDMNGHSIVSNASGVYCRPGRCTIVGPGSLSSPNNCGIQTEPNSYVTRIFATGIDIHDSNQGICASTAKLTKMFLTDVTVTGSATSGISGPGADGAGSVSGTRLTVTGSGFYGIKAQRIHLRSSTVTGNGGIGTFAWRGMVALFGSTVTGNDTTDGLDVASKKRPNIMNSNCGLSARAQDFPALPDSSSPAWGMCTND